MQKERKEKFAHMIISSYKLGRGSYKFSEWLLFYLLNLVKNRLISEDEITFWADTAIKANELQKQ